MESHPSYKSYGIWEAVESQPMTVQLVVEFPILCLMVKTEYLPPYRTYCLWEGIQSLPSIIVLEHKEQYTKAQKDGATYQIHPSMQFTSSLLVYLVGVSILLFKSLL